MKGICLAGAQELQETRRALGRWGSLSGASALNSVSECENVTALWERVCFPVSAEILRVKGKPAPAWPRLARSGQSAPQLSHWGDWGHYTVGAGQRPSLGGRSAQGRECQSWDCSDRTSELRRGKRLHGIQRKPGEFEVLSFPACRERINDLNSQRTVPPAHQ